MQWVLWVVGWLWATLGAFDFWLSPTPASFQTGMLMFVLPGIAIAGLGSLVGAVRAAVPKPTAEAPKTEAAAE